MTNVVVGVFVGGRGLRMGGVAKGLLRAPSGGSLLERLLEQCAVALPGARPVLIGDATAYAAVRLRAVPDAPSGIGPIGGLRALLCEAQRSEAEAVLAVACDMPFVSARLLRRLASEQPTALALAPCEGTRWDPLLARYSIHALSAVDAAIAAGERSLQRVFARLGSGAHALELDLDERRELSDWDTPSDLNDNTKGY